MDPSILVPLLLLVAAPAVGSFACLVADRWPDQSVIIGRSECDHCGAPLRYRDLVPLAGWLTARGTSRCCGKPLRAVLVMAECAALAVTAWALWVVPGPVGWISVGLAWALLALSLVDLAHLRLPDVGTLGLILAGLVLAAIGWTGPVWQHALGAVVGFGVLAGIGWAYREVRGADGLGLGDAKLLAAAGAWCGVVALPSILLIGCVSGIVMALLLGRVQAKAAVPFGPALALGFWVTWLHGPMVFVTGS